MPIYEYKGQQYDIATDDPTAAKAKILNYIGTQEPAPVKKAAQATEPEAEPSLGSPMGTGLEEILAQPNRERKTYTGSVFDTQPFEPSPRFNPAEAARLSNRAYAEDTTRPPRRTQYAKATPQNQLERSTGQAISDTVIGALQGAVGIPKSIAANINAGDNPVANFFDSAVQAGERSKSPYLRNQKAQREAFIKNVGSNQGELASARATFNSMFSPAGADVIAQGAGSMIPTVGMSLLGVGRVAMGAVNALSVAGEATQNTAQKLSQMSPEDWSNSSAYQELRNSGVSHKDAVNMLAPLFALPNQALGLVIGGVSGVTGLEKTLAGKSVKGGARERAARAGSELLGEEAETLVPSFAANITRRIFDDKQSLVEGLGKEAVETAFGTVPGAALAASGRAGKPTTQAPVSRPDIKPEPVAETERIEPTFDDAAFTAPPPATPPPSTAVQADQIRAEKITALTQVLEQQGIPADNAERIATRKVDAELKVENRVAAVKVPEGRVEEITQDLIAAGVPPQKAKLDAQNLAQEEAQADELAQAETGEPTNVAEPIQEPVGASASVAEQPNTGLPTGGVAEPDARRVVPAGQDVASANVGEGVESAALTPTDTPIETPIATPTEPEGTTTDGITTTETQQATQEEQAPPAAGGAAKGKPGRPPVQQRHAVVKTPEGKFDHVTDGAVTATYANNKQATAAVNLAKAQDANNPTKIAKFEAELKNALASKGKGRPPKPPAAEGTVELDNDTRQEMEALESALKAYNSPASGNSIANAAMYISDAAVDPTVPKAVRERAQQMLENDVDPKDIPKKLKSTDGNVGKGDAGFNSAANGAQAITRVIKTGNAFQRFVGERIRNFLSGVKFVVLEKGDTIPARMEGARGLFVYDPKTKERTVYVRGASFGGMQGINNITVLHEMLHAATTNRITAGLLNNFRNAQLQKFVREMSDIMKRAEQEYKDLTYLDMVDEGVNDVVSRTYDPKTDSYDIFTSPYEFLAYGMSSPEFQKFLMSVKGVRKEPTLFSAFANSIRDLFGIKQGEATAFSDLVDITDKMLGTRVTPTTAQSKISLQQKGKGEEKNKPNPLELFDEQADIRVKRTALELERDARKAKQKVAESREGDMTVAVEAMQKERDPSKVRQILANAWSKFDYAQRQALVRLPTFDFLAKWAGEKGMSSLGQTNVYLTRMLGMSQQFLVGAEQIIGMLDRGFKEDSNLSRKQFDNFVYATTIAEIDPSDPNAIERSTALDADYKALGPVGQRMYKTLRDYYESIIELYSDLLDEQIQTAQGLTQDEKNKLMVMLRKTFEAEVRIHPYFPLVRRGDFWLAIGSGESRRFYTFESREDRNAKAEQLAAARGEDTEDLLFRQEFVQGNDLGSLRTASKDSSQMLKQTFDAIDKMELGEDSGAAKEGLKDAVYQIYLNTMPEQTFRKQFTHRKNRTGFSTDLRQNVATTAAKQATQLARLKYSPLLRNSLSAARDSIREREELSPFVEEAEKRINLALSGTSGGLGDAVAGAANKASFFWFLSGASSALIQPSSVFISGLPVLAGNYGSAAGAAKELGKMTLLVNQYSILRTNSDGTTSISSPSIANNKSLPQDERRAVGEMVSRGVSESTYASMVWGYKRTPTESLYFSKEKGFGNIPVAYGKGKRLASLLVGALMHNTERLSREAVYLAAYRLGKKQGLSYDNAVQKAVDSTNEALGNYDVTNKPRFMQQGIGKVAFQFKTYPLQMTLLLLTNFKNMLPFLNKEGKREAATKFFGMMGTSALLGGVANMALFSPIIGLIGWAWGKMSDDEDWPEDLKKLSFETWFRTVFLPQQLGDVKVGGVPVSDIVDRGVLNALTGYDIASRVGLNDLWGRDSKETKTSRDSATAFLLDNFAGPTASLLLGFADAYDAYAMGDYQKMQEKLAPAAIRNLLVANKYAEEGMKTGRGAELIGKDDVKTGELIGQAIGFRPDILAATQGTAFKLTGIEQRIGNQRTAILNKLDLQLRQNTDKGDERFDKILEDEVTKFNTKYPSYALDADTIYKSLNQKAEQRAGSRAGVVMTEKNIPIVEEATNTLEDRLDRRAQEMAERRKAEKNPR